MKEFSRFDRFLRFLYDSLGALRYFPIYVNHAAKQWMRILFGESLLGAVFIIWWGMSSPPLALIFSAAVLVAAFYVWYAEYHPIAKKDVVELMQQVPELNIDEVERRWEEIDSHLIRNGIRTRKQLSELVNAIDCLDIIRRIYHEQLKRPMGNSLDPIAVADYVAKLYVSGRSNNMRKEIEDEIKWHFSKGAK